MPGEVLTQLYWYIYPHRIVCKIKSFFNVFTVTAEVLCLLTIALDRYRKICTPFGWQIQPKFAIVLCGVIYALAFILALPVAFFWGIHHSEEQYQNHTVFKTECETDEQFNGTSHPLKYSIAVECIISICLSVMIILYLFVARKLVTGKHNIVVKSKIKVKANFPSSQPGASSEVFDKNEYELSSRQENSDTECSSDVESKPKKAEYNYISSDGGLTTDEAEDSTGRTIKLTLPIGNTENPVRTQTKSQKLTSKRGVGLRVRRKTKIVLILTVLFIFTTILYLTLLSFIAKNMLLNMSAGEKTVYFFFFRLYFINHVLNPVLYGFLDPHFKKVMLQLKHTFCVCTPHSLQENK
ncbi:neuropeptide Y receptor type 5-like [Mercenaria mercenaria]|uniref:neuropeptide Y receptor type 5-like n=1 Tax=Mercenaria mercenaria TaxID=6596 RepID=UPI00234F9691|nr:neuropeptide Y receptor type 5-like [Mercenaria mercenaria]